MSRHLLRQVPAGGVQPLRSPIRRATAARLSLHRYRIPRGVIRFREQVSDAALRDYFGLRVMLHTRTAPDGWTVLPVGEPEPETPRPQVDRRPWWRPLLSRSRW